MVTAKQAVSVRVAARLGIRGQIRCTEIRVAGMEALARCESSEGFKTLLACMVPCLISDLTVSAGGGVVGIQVTAIEPGVLVIIFVAHLRPPIARIVVNDARITGTVCGQEISVAFRAWSPRSLNGRRFSGAIDEFKI